MNNNIPFNKPYFTGKEITVNNLFMYLQKYFVEKKPFTEKGKLVFKDIPVNIPFSTFRNHLQKLMDKGEIDFRMEKHLC